MMSRKIYIGILLWLNMTENVSSTILPALENSDRTYLVAAQTYLKQGKRAQALYQLRQAISYNPNNIKANMLMGKELLKQNKNDEARACFEHVLTLTPHNFQAAMHVGLCHMQNSHYDQAFIAFEQARALNPTDNIINLQSARAAYKMQKLDTALSLYEEALKIDSSLAEAYIYRGQIFQQIDLLEAAEYSLFHACTLILPEQSGLMRELCNNLLSLGNRYFNERRSEDALRVFNKILTLGQFAATYHNIGFTLAEQQGKFYEAIEAYQKALAINPSAVETHFCLAMSLLAIGDYANGFKEYRWRWQRGSNRPRSFPYPLPSAWDSSLPLHNKSILLRAEQGLGDTLQFIRYAQVLKDQGAHVIVEAQAPLLTLLQECPYIDALVPIGCPCSCDVQIPLLDLPYICKTTLDTIPVCPGYLHAKDDLVKEWKDKLSKDTKFKIGICWHGDASHSESKFMPLSYWTRLNDLQNISIYSLQRIDGLDQQLTLTTPLQMHCFDASFDVKNGRFMDTAAVMEALDLVISVDTSIAHLAGGLGVPVWVILPFPAEWRWLHNRTDSPWYPTMQLFRQTNPTDWESVIEALLAKLEQTIPSQIIAS